MWKQFTKVTAADFNTPGNDPTIPDCVMDSNDPIMPGAKPSTATFDSIPQTNKGQIMREQNIKPGTEKWFALWFGDKR